MKKIVAWSFEQEVENSTKPYVLLFNSKENHLVNKMIETLAEAQLKIGEIVNFGFLNLAKNETPLNVKGEQPIIGLFQNGDITDYYSNTNKLSLVDWIRCKLIKNEL